MEKNREYESMGTKWEIKIWDEISEKEFEKIMEEIINMSQEFDKTYSRFIKESLVTKISTQTGIIKVSEDFMNLLVIYKKGLPLIQQFTTD